MKEFLEPKLEVQNFLVEDIITTSATEETTDNGIELPDIDIPG